MVFNWRTFTKTNYTYRNFRPIQFFLRFGGCVGSSLCFRCYCSIHLLISIICASGNCHWLYSMICFFFNCFGNPISLCSVFTAIHSMPTFEFAFDLRFNQPNSTWRVNDVPPATRRKKNWIISRTINLVLNKIFQEIFYWTSHDIFVHKSCGVYELWFDRSHFKMHHFKTCWIQLTEHRWQFW